MKRHLLWLSLCGTLQAAAQTPLTLNLASYANWQIGTDSLNRVDSPAALPNLTPAANATWDLSTQNYNDAVVIYRKPNANPAFPGSQHYDSIRYVLNPAVVYTASKMTAIGSAGVVESGEALYRQVIPLAAITFNPNDSLVFPQQNIMYSNLSTRIAFPATYHSSWASAFTYATNFNLTVAAAGLVNAPCQRKSNYTRKDSVVGYGKMRVKTTAGTPSGYMDVLQVKTMEKYVDSFYVNGIPAPATLLAAFGLTQGFTTKTWDYNFYRTGELAPLARVRFPDSTYSTNKAMLLDVHAQRLAGPNGVPAIGIEDHITVYPNPVADKHLYLLIGNQFDGTVGYELIQVNGQLAAHGNTLVTAGRGEVKLPDHTAPGLYFLRCSSNHQTFTSMPLLIQ